MRFFYPQMPFVLLFFILYPSICAVAQHQSGYCHIPQSHIEGKTTVADPAEDNYDIRYVKLNLNMTNASTVLSGDATTSALVVSSSLPVYVFELDSAYTIDSVLINGLSQPVTSAASLRSVSVATALPAGSMFTAQVFYHGACTTGMGYFGINSVASGIAGQNVTYTMNEPYYASEWWPCKQSLHDKIDSSDVWITVPGNLKVGSNGLLDTVMVIDSGHVRYQWRERYPIDYYLISVAIYPYTEYAYYMHFTGSTDSMLIKNYVYDNTALVSYQPVLDNLAAMINYFSSLYGRYPFWKEKYGISQAPIGDGGMENETMTTIGSPDPVIMAHELGHQWFGDNVTCGTWSDITMNEGYASYTEDLYRDHFNSHADMISDMQSKQSSVEGWGPGTIYVTDTTSIPTLFSGTFTYNKGACVLHMLRHVIDNDSAFFAVYRAYQSAFSGGTGTILDFRNTLKSQLGATINGINIDSFYNQWYFEEGLPVYNINWNQRGNDVWMQITQNTSVPASVSLFNIPIDVQFQSGSGDTTIRVIIDSNAEFFHFTWANSGISQVVLDPDSWMVYRLDSITMDSTLNIRQTTRQALKIEPNPAATQWTVNGLMPGTDLQLTDLTAREVWRGNSGTSGQVVIPAQDLAAGLYILKAGNDANTGIYKLVKK